MESQFLALFIAKFSAQPAALPRSTMMSLMPSSVPSATAGLSPSALTQAVRIASRARSAHLAVCDVPHNKSLERTRSAAAVRYAGRQLWRAAQLQIR